MVRPTSHFHRNELHDRNTVRHTLRLADPGPLVYRTAASSALGWLFESGMVNRHPEE